MIPIAQHAPGAIRHLADPALRALVPAAVAALVLWLLRVRQSSLRLAAWTGVLYAALAMPFLGGLLPGLPLRLPALPLRQAASAPSTQPGLHPPSGSSAALGLLPTRFYEARVPATLTNTPAQHHSIPWPLVALAAYALVTACLLGRLAVGLALGRRLSRESHPISDSGVQLALETQARALGLGRIPQLAQSEAVTVPLTVGVLNPVILLPSGWREWENTKLAAVIAHELSHVKRHDGLTRILSLGYWCFFWFSPLAWWLDRHLTDLAEQASDQEAIAAGTEPTYYAEVLMSFLKAINKGQGRVSLQGVSMARGARAGHRIEKEFIERAGMGLGALAVLGKVDLRANPYGMPIGLQLYTVRDHLEKDLAGTFRRVADIGYRVVELGGSFNFYGKKPGELKRMLNDAGLQALSTHFTEQQLKADLRKQIADSKECGITYIGLASLDDRDRQSLDAIRRDADWFNRVGEATSKAGCRFFYHGHNFDYASVDGVVEYDELIRRTDPKLANFELDCFWCVRAGKDPVDYFNRFPGRFLQLHIKDLKPGFPPTTQSDDRPAFTEVGQGVIDWRKIFKAARKGGLQHFCVEQDQCDRDSLESARISYEYLHQLKV